MRLLHAWRVVRGAAAVARVAALEDFGHLLRGLPRGAWPEVIARESPY